jgi:hypothetical protein
MMCDPCEMISHSPSLPESNRRAYDYDHIEHRILSDQVFRHVKFKKGGQVSLAKLSRFGGLDTNIFQKLKPPNTEYPVC